MTDDSYREDVYESHDDMLITREDLDSLIGELNNELGKVVVQLGEESLVQLIQQIVTALAHLEDLFVFNKEISESRAQLLEDLKYLEEKYEREKIYRISCESKLLQVEFENEEERCSFKATIEEQLRLIRQLERKCMNRDFDSLSSGFVESDEMELIKNENILPINNCAEEIVLSSELQENEPDYENGQSILKLTLDNTKREINNDVNLDVSCLIMINLQLFKMQFSDLLFFSVSSTIKAPHPQCLVKQVFPERRFPLPWW